MSLLLQLFGEDILRASLADVKKQIKDLPPAPTERKGYLLKEFAKITNKILTEQDFRDVGA